MAHRSKSGYDSWVLASSAAATGWEEAQPMTPDAERDGYE